MNKYYYLLPILLLGCSPKLDNSTITKVNLFKQKNIEINLHESLNYNGYIKTLNNNSWVFNSHTNSLCINKTNSSCRKSDANFKEDILKPNEVTKISFEFEVVAYNKVYTPDWVIIYQDWVRIIPTDTNGNHPITTLKLKIIDNKINLCSYDNAWQWGYDFGTNVLGNAIDVDHSLHQKNTLNGCKQIEVGISYDINIVTYKSGRFIYSVNDSVISDNFYQTKSKDEPHIIQWGLYWSKGYNLNNDPLKQIIVRFDNFTYSTKYL